MSVLSKLSGFLSLLGAYFTVEYGVMPNAKKACESKKPGFLKNCLLCVILISTLYYALPDDIKQLVIRKFSEIYMYFNERNRPATEHIEAIVQRYKDADKTVSDVTMHSTEEERDTEYYSPIHDDMSEGIRDSASISQGVTEDIKSSDDSSPVSIIDPPLIIDTTIIYDENNGIAQSTEKPIENEYVTPSEEFFYSVPSLEVDLSEYYSLSDMSLNESTYGNGELRIISQEIITTYDTEQHIISETITYSYDPAPISVSEETISDYIVLPSGY